MHANKTLKLLEPYTKLYAALAVATVVVLAILSITKPHLATKDAWVHAVVVAIFAIVLPKRAAAARSGKRSALRATGLIASVLLLVNVIEGLLPNFMPLWMRIDMFIVAVLMAVIIGLVIAASVHKKV